MGGTRLETETVGSEGGALLAQDVTISVESDGSGLDVVASAASQSDFLRLLQVQS